MYEEVEVEIGPPEALRVLLEWMDSKNIPLGNEFKSGNSEVSLIDVLASNHSILMILDQGESGAAAGLSLSLERLKISPKMF